MNTIPLVQNPKVPKVNFLNFTPRQMLQKVSYLRNKYPNYSQNLHCNKKITKGIDFYLNENRILWRKKSASQSK